MWKYLEMSYRELCGINQDELPSGERSAFLLVKQAKQPNEMRERAKELTRHRSFRSNEPSLDEFLDANREKIERKRAEIERIRAEKSHKKGPEGG